MDRININIYKIQMVYFFKEDIEFKAFELIGSLYNQLNDIFQTEPQVLQVPPEAPADLPSCIWNDKNVNLIFNKIKLDYTFNIPSKSQWHQLLDYYNEKLNCAFTEKKISIDRVGLICEAAFLDNLQSILKDYINIEQFNEAKEANISWLEKNDQYNEWIYFIINENQNKIVFDINSFQENKLSDRGISGEEAMRNCSDLLERKMGHVF